MKDDADTLRIRLERLLELTELAWHAPLEDRARIERSIQFVQFVSRAIAAIAENQEARQRAALMTEEAKACQVRRRNDLADQMARLRFLRKRIPK
jgi:GAF domain-containing protein